MNDVEVNGSVGVDVGMVDPGREIAPRRLGRVVSRESDVHKEGPSCVGAVRGTSEYSSPMEQICATETGFAAGNRLTAKISKLLGNTCLCHLSFTFLLPLIICDVLIPLISRTMTCRSKTSQKRHFISSPQRLRFHFDDGFKQPRSDMTSQLSQTFL